LSKAKFTYNHRTLQYEQHNTPLRVKLLRLLLFMVVTAAVALLVVWISFKLIDRPQEKLLRSENDKLIAQLQKLKDTVQFVNLKMQELEKQDNELYRSFFGISPLPDSARAQALFNKREWEALSQMDETDIVSSIKKQTALLQSRMGVMQQSLQNISALAKNKDSLLKVTPNIQPVSNKNLTRIASGFGYRIDPVYGGGKFHAGLDFAAPEGTPIYATANGRVIKNEYSAGGYGNHVVIEHGFGYETLYGHMVKSNVSNGQIVTRGQVIGYVGSTGKSTGPHLHYEVHKNGQKLDPIYFFFTDLSPAQYDAILQLANSKTKSFD
jgi:murein DD-endopeptidase MepM/ murein hydrolase activator NlpD